MAPQSTSDSNNADKREAREKKISAFNLPIIPNFQISDISAEARQDFLNGCFRSSILCSAIVVEQSLMDSLILNSEDWKGTYRRTERSNSRFDYVIFQARKKRFASIDIINEADWLRRARNKVAAHPLFVGMIWQVKKGQLEMKKDDVVIWANKTMIREFGRLLNFLEPEMKKEIEDTECSGPDKNGNIVYFTIKDVVCQKTTNLFFNTVLCVGLKEQLLEEIALAAYGKMVRVVTSLLQPSNN